MGDPSKDFVKLRSDDVVWRQVGDEVLLLDTASSEYLSVNETGSTLWPLLMEGCSRSNLVEALVDKFEIAADRASADTDAFLSSLRGLGLLQEQGTPV